MTVVPLVVKEDGEDARADVSVVTDKAGWSLDADTILIIDLDRDQLTRASNECNASYDLRVGDHYRDHRNPDGQTLAEGGSIQLLPGGAVIIQTEEEVHFPKGIYGIILPKVSLLQKGIANTPTKIDPGYEGRLLITAFNHGRRTVQLARGQRFCAFTAFRVEDGVKPYAHKGKQIEGEAGGRFGQRMLDKIQTNAGVIAALALLATVVKTLVDAVREWF